ncbi:MAG: PPK2 family polyphosphate:nucleotide phosphotransferase [Flavobacteriales bacterium]|jgi:PPK2 family polyphosphate:nucleotide phosphotransferase
MKDTIAKSRISSEGGFKQSDHQTKVEISLSKKESKRIIRENVKVIAEIQDKMFAQQGNSVLLVFQAMDAAGKDSTIERVITGINPQGVFVHSFKKPTEEELSHDYMWRINKALPPKGKMGVFNRSHYEEVLVTRVHPEFIVYQKLPGIASVGDIPDDFWQHRFDTINAWEKHLSDNGTTILKFFLNVSFEEQEQRLLDRMNEQEKHWKFKLQDVKERAHWPAYSRAFEEAINATSKENAPWFVIPADDKKVMRAMVTQIVREELEKLPITWPRSHSDIEQDISEGRRMLSAD